MSVMDIQEVIWKEQSLCGKHNNDFIELMACKMSKSSSSRTQRFRLIRRVSFTQNASAAMNIIPVQIQAQYPSWGRIVSREKSSSTRLISRETATENIAACYYYRIQIFQNYNTSNS